MPERAQFEVLTGQLDMWRDYSRPACDRLRGESAA
jgi:hypothetical protein